MQNSRNLAIKTALLMAFAALAIQAQTAQRCDLAGKDTTLNGQPAKQCLDVASLKNQTIAIPSNVTRIDNQGLALCTKSVTTGGDADFLFVLDQSGSMGLSFIYVNPNPPRDTIYYADNGGCTIPGTDAPNAIGKPPGGNIYPTPVTIQTAAGPVTVWSIKNNANCNSLSGDPFKVRATVVSKAIDAIVSTSTNSTIGYIPFAHDIWTPANCQRPLTLTAANITTLKNKIIIDSSYGTIYNRPLDSAKQWLNTPLNLGRNPTKRAIVFISDGQPSNPDSDGFAKNLNGTYKFIDKTIPIYGIFLGGTAAETRVLEALCDTTRPAQTGGPGGRVPLGSDFYRVPPSRPDSINGVMKAILNKIITSYSPTLFTITNTTLNVTSSATLANQFIDQGGGNYKIVLDSVLPLQTGTNNIRVISRLSSLPTTPPTPVITQSDTANFALNVGAGSGASFLGGLITKCYNPTSLQWLNSSGIRPASGYFTDSDATVQVLVTTSKNGLATIRPVVRTSVPPPDTLKALTLPRGTDSLRYSATIPIAAPFGSIGVPNTANTTLENKISDTLKGCWQNPRDPRDNACDLIPIHPTNKQATAYFSNDSLGTTNISQFALGVTQAYVIVKDQRGDPAHFPYQVTITLRSGDREVINLTQSIATPGLFYARLTLVQTTTGVQQNNGTLQYSNLGDQMFGTYTDPINLDQATCQAGIGQPPQFTPYMQFTDATGAVLPTGTVIPNTKFWSLANGKVYLTVTDFNKTNFTSVPVQISARSTKLGQTVSQDAESMVQGQKRVINGDLADWRDSIPLGESLAPAANGRLEGAYRIVVTATAHPHDSTGAELLNQTMTDSVVIAYPDSSGSLNFSDVTNAADPTGPSSLIDTLRDQNFVRVAANDVVTATALCIGSTADSVQLNFTQVPSGGYISDVLVRDIGTPNTTDTKLTCPVDSGVIVKYTDPVYGTQFQQVIQQVLTPVATPPDTFFVAGLNITLQTGTTGALIDYTLDGSIPLIGPVQQYTGQFSIGTTRNVKALASKVGYLRSRILSATYLLQPKALAGYVKDIDRDGAGDLVVLVFERPIPAKPDTIDTVYWNKEAPGYLHKMYNVTMTADSLVLSAVPNPSTPFGLYQTGIPDPAHPPMVKFPLGGYFNGLRVPLMDAMGPIPASARKLPSDLKVAYIDANGQKIVNPDTLLINTSEPIDSVDQSGVSHFFNTLFRFSSGVSNCAIPDTGKTTIAVQEIHHLKDSLTSDGLQSIFQLIVDNRGNAKTPQIGDCIYLDGLTGNFTDFDHNIPGKGGVVLNGGNSKKSIQGLDGYPPVSGLTPGSRAFNLANNSTTGTSTVNTNTSGNIEWVAPQDFPANYVAGAPYTPKATHVISDTVVTATDSKVKESLPKGFSTLQVVTAGGPSGRYIAHVHLSDHLGHFVKSWNQDFGFNGELKNVFRRSNSGVTSFLVWDGRDSKNQLAGQGVYVWSVIFETPNGKETLVRRTGYVR